MQNNQDGWETVSDPREVKKVLGVKGVQGLQKQAQQQGAPQGETDQPVRPPQGQAAQGAYTKVAAARTMLQQLNHVRSLYDKNMSATGLAGLNEFNPVRRENQEFDGAVSAIPLLARQAFRVQGSGADSDRELKLITDALPSRWSFDSTNQERFKTLDRVLRNFISTYGPLAGYDEGQVKRFVGQNVYGQRALPKAPPRRQPAAQPKGWTITRKN